MTYFFKLCRSFCSVYNNVELFRSFTLITANLFYLLEFYYTLKPCTLHKLDLSYIFIIKNKSRKELFKDLLVTAKLYDTSNKGGLMNLKTFKKAHKSLEIVFKSTQKFRNNLETL